MDLYAFLDFCIEKQSHTKQTVQIEELEVI